MCQHSSRASVDRRRVSSGIAPTIARNRLSGKTIGNFGPDLDQAADCSVLCSHRFNLDIPRPAFRDGGGWHIRGAESFSGSRSMRPRIADLKTFPLSQLSVTRRDDDAVDVSAFANNLGFGWTEAQR